MKIESLSTGDVFLYSLVGLLVVLASLAILACLIMLVSKIVSRFAGEKAPAAPAPAAAVKPAATSAAPAAAAKPAIMATVGELKLRNVDDQTAALLMAIVADQTKIPLNELRFKSIKCLNP